MVSEFSKEYVAYFHDFEVKEKLLSTLNSLFVETKPIKIKAVGSTETSETTYPAP
jgi:hypothetical protein